MNDKKKKKILLIGVIIGVILAAIIISAIILFRDDTKEGVHEGGTFTEKMTEGVILLKDMGFGEMFPATGKIIVFPFTLIS